MSEQESAEKEIRQPGDAQNWAPLTPWLHADQVPPGPRNINMEHRRVSGPLQGFGPLWQKTFRARFEGIDVTPEEVVALWKQVFPELQPRENRFYPSLQGIKPGELMWIEAAVPPAPGMPSVLPVSTGVLILYADETSFTVMTPEGHPVSGWDTFSAYEEDGVTVAQIQSQARTSDPIYELAFRFMDTSAQQNKIWTHVLEQLAARFDIEVEVTLDKELLDSRIQWRSARNIWHNAAARTVFYTMATPVRWLTGNNRRPARAIRR